MLLEVLLEVTKAWRHTARANFMRNVVLPAIDLFDKDESSKEQTDKNGDSSEETKEGR